MTPQLQFSNPNPKRVHPRTSKICPELNAWDMTGQSASRSLFNLHNGPRQTPEQAGVSYFTRPRRDILEEWTFESTYSCLTPTISSPQHAHLPKAFHFAASSVTNHKHLSGYQNSTPINDTASSAPHRSHGSPSPYPTISSKPFCLRRGRASSSTLPSLTLKEEALPNRLGRNISHEGRHYADVAATMGTHGYESDSMATGGTDFSGSETTHSYAAAVNILPSDNAASASLTTHTSTLFVRSHGSHSTSHACLSLGSQNHTSVEDDTRNGIHCPCSSGSSPILRHPAAVS